MKSDVYTVEKNLSNISVVLDKLEFIAQASDMDERSKHYFRLLAEELVLSVTRILPQSRLLISVESDDKAFYTQLTAKASIFEEEREKLIAISSSGKNALPKGFFGKLAYFMNTMYDPNTPGATFLTHASDGMFLTADFGAVYSPAENSYNWSYADFKKQAQPDELDGIEKRLIENCADDVRVCAQYNEVTLTAIKYLK